MLTYCPVGQERSRNRDKRELRPSTASVGASVVAATAGIAAKNKSPPN